MAETIHKSDIGTIFEAQLLDGITPLPLVGASSLQLVFETATGVVKTVDAELTSDGADGKIEYATEADFLDSVGQWRWQCALTLPDWSGHSDVASFEVYPNLDD